MTPQPRETAMPPTTSDPIEQLVRIAEPRQPVPADRLARVRAAAHAEWQTHTRQRRRRTRVTLAIIGLASAAVLVLAMRAGHVRWSTTDRLGRELAAVARVRGAVTRVSAPDTGRDPAPVRLGDWIREGDSVATSSSGWLAVRLSGGGTLRLDRETRMRWVSATAVALDAGSVYIAGGHQRSEAPADARLGVSSFEVHTPYGIVREVGTQFEVRVDDAALRVRVREGLVRVSESRSTHDVRSGDEMTLGGDGRIAWRSIAPFGTDWAWVAALAAPYELEGGSLQAFLEWVTAETGLAVRFTRRADEQKAATMILHGSIDGLTPDQALDAVLPVSGVDHERIDGELVIRGIADDVAR